jgi:hypothetical protein
MRVTGKIAFLELQVMPATAANIFVSAEGLENFNNHAASI